MALNSMQNATSKSLSTSVSTSTATSSNNYHFKKHMASSVGDGDDDDDDVQIIKIDDSGVGDDVQNIEDLSTYHRNWQPFLINNLPNEVLALILEAIPRDDKHKCNPRLLAPLRLVCPKWQETVDMLFHKEFSLALTSKAINRRFVTSRFFGGVAYEDFVTFKLKYIEEGAPMSKLTYFDKGLNQALESQFLRIKQLIFNCVYNAGTNENLIQLLNRHAAHLHTLLFDAYIHEPEQDDLYECINSLTELRRLSLRMQTLPLNAHKLVPTLSRINHLYVQCTTFDINELVKHLGPSCVRFLLCNDYIFDFVGNWPQLNPTWIAAVTHLSMKLTASLENMHVISQHFTSLQELHLYNFDDPRNGFFRVETKALAKLGGLSHLHTLQLEGIRLSEHFVAPSGVIEMAKANRVPCTSLRTLRISNFTVEKRHSPQEFCRSFAAIAPNLEHLHLVDERRRHADFFQRVKEFLCYFAKLKTHKFEVRPQ